jgi:hypothetical protein
VSRLAKDVAKELEKRARRRKILFLGAIAGLLVLAFMYLQCGVGWGFGGGGGSGTGSGTSTGTGTATEAKRCSVKVAVGGTTVDGVSATVPEAVAKCTGGADLVCTAAARQGDCDSMRAALEAAKIPTYVAH